MPKLVRVETFELVSRLNQAKTIEQFTRALQETGYEFQIRVRKYENEWSDITEYFVKRADMKEGKEFVET